MMVLDPSDGRLKTLRIAAFCSLALDPLMAPQHGELNQAGGRFMAPLLLCTMLAKYWGICHKCKFRLEIHLSEREPHSCTKYPNNANYITLIKELNGQLLVNITWVKCQQDKKQPFGKKLTRNGCTTQRGS